MKKQINIIKLTDTFRVKVDDLNHKLQQYVEVEDKETKEIKMTWSTIGYYANLANAIKSAMNEDLRDATSLANVLERIKQFEDKIDQQFKK